jgi:DNA-directed RNA polymerase specialized sigma24 family protein
LHLPDEPNIINDIKEKEQLLNWMHEGLQLLHADQQQCVTLFYLDKNSYQQIATTTGFTMLQVKSFIQNGKRNLKMMIEKKLLLKEQKS